MCLEANRVNANIGSPAFCDLPDALDRILFFKIDDIRICDSFRGGEPIGFPVDANHFSSSF